MQRVEKGSYLVTLSSHSIKAAQLPGLTFIIINVEYSMESIDGA